MVIRTSSRLNILGKVYASGDVVLGGPAVWSEAVKRREVVRYLRLQGSVRIFGGQSLGCCGECHRRLCPHRSPSGSVNGNVLNSHKSVRGRW